MLSFCKLLFIAGTLVYSAGAVYEHRFEWPALELEVVRNSMDAAGRSEKEIERMVDFMATLSPAVGHALLNIDSRFGYFISAGVDSAEFKTLLAIVLPNGYERLRQDGVNFPSLMRNAHLVLPIMHCAFLADSCANIRTLLGQSDFAMAAFLVNQFNADGPPARFRQAFLANFFNDPDGNFQVETVAPLLSLETFPEILALVKRLRIHSHLYDRTDPNQTTELLRRVWNRLLGQAVMGL